MDLIPSSQQNPPCSHPTRSKGQTPLKHPQALHHTAPPPLWPHRPFTSLLTLHQPPSPLSLNVLPQGLCTCSCSHLDCSYYIQIGSSLTSFSDLLLRKASPGHPNIQQPTPGTSEPPCQHVAASGTLLCMVDSYGLCLSPLDCKILEGRRLGLFSSL